MTNTTETAKRHFQSMLTDIPSAPFYAKTIREMVADGTTNWDELGFTEAEVTKREQEAKVGLAKRHFDSMLTKIPSAPFYAKTIREMVADGTTNWDELGFTEAEVTKREQEAKVGLAKRHFDSMLTKIPSAPFYAKTIREMVADGTTNWDELGFTEAEVTKRERKAK